MSHPAKYDAYVSSTTDDGVTYKIGVAEGKFVLELYSKDNELGEGITLEMCDEAPASCVLSALADALEQLAEDAYIYENRNEPEPTPTDAALN